MATRGFHGLGAEETSLILDSPDVQVLHTCLNQGLDLLGTTQLSDARWIYKDALERIRAALHEPNPSERPRRHVVRPA